MWIPEAAVAPFRVLAFATAGGPPSTPGPLIRVPAGTTLAITVRNRHTAAVIVHGLAAEPLSVPAGGEASVRAPAGPPRTALYWATIAPGVALDKRSGVDSLLSGALIVDGDGVADRVFVIAHHTVKLDKGSREAWAINGRSWPDTERVTVRVGEPVRWRLINASDEEHPMHLHGTYFRVDNGPLVVTEVMPPGRAAIMTWQAGRPGNWLFHCHILFHVMPELRAPPEVVLYPEYADLPHDQHMSGLVLGIHAASAPVVAAAPAAAREPRRLSLVVGQRRDIRYRLDKQPFPGLGYSTSDELPPTAPGPTLVIERGRPVEIAIKNNLTRATAVHWHGIELDSYYDGVPHWGGDGTQVTPHIAPRGGTFVARFTPPRAGTFIYHTHFNDYAQLGAGLYGALIVVDPPYDPSREHVFVIGRDGLDDRKDPVVIDGHIEPKPRVLEAGRPHRLRLIGITPAPSVTVRLARDGREVTWRALARDGADLAAALAVSGPAHIEISPGQTFDFEIVPEPGELLLTVDLGDHHARQRLLVR
jgi:FtsP/CotA-like multicopper oxidase with cupredoxin domain